MYKKNAIYRDNIYSECITIQLHHPTNQGDFHQIQNKSCFAIFVLTENSHCEISRMKNS